MKCFCMIPLNHGGVWAVARIWVLCLLAGLLCLGEAMGQGGGAALAPRTAMPAASYGMEQAPWVLEGKFSSPAMPADAVQTFAGTRQSSSKFKGWDLAMVGGQIRFMSTPLRGTSSSFLTPKRYDDGMEHALRLVWEPQGRQVTLFVDGQAAGSVGGVAPVTGAPGLLFVFGAKQNSTQDGWMFEWQGNLGEWRFYSNLPAGNVVSTASADAVEAQELAVADDSGGTALPPPQQSARPPLAQRAALPAANYGMENAPWVLEGSFASQPMTGGDAQTLAGTRQSSSKFKGWDLCMLGGQIRFMSTPLRGTSSSFLTDKRYDNAQAHALRLVWNPQGRQVTLFVDGQSVGSVGGVAPVTGAPGLVFVLGAKQDPTTGGWLYEWPGNLGDWRFYPNASPENVGAQPAPSAAAAPAQRLASVAGQQTHALKTIALKGPQVALTWQEGAGKQRTVLVYDKPITEQNRREARVLAEKMLPGSANDWYEDPSQTNRPALTKRGWVLGPDAAPLDVNDGLFVHTAKQGDPEEIYFAVLADGEMVVAGENATVSPVSLKAGVIEAIPQTEEAVTQMQGTKPGLPVVLYLHPHTSRPSGKLTHLFFGDETMGWSEGLPFKFKVTVNADHILVEPHDRVWINRKLQSGEVTSSFDSRYQNIESWWYGTNEFINDPAMRAKGRIVNYTDRWLLWMLDWVIENYRADANRVYGFGTSMGTAVQVFAFNHPERFASVDVLVPFVDWSYVGAEGSNLKRLSARLGGLDVKTPDGKTLAYEMNLITRIEAQTDDLPFMVVRCGRNDKSVFWERKPAYFEAMNRKGNGLLAQWDQGDHSSAGRTAIAGFPAYREMGWYLERFAVNKSYPAILNYSGNDDYGNGGPASGAPVGFINRGLDWRVTQDTAKGYQIEFLRTQGAPEGPLSFDFVVRRPQGFKPRAGDTLEVEYAGAGGAAKRGALKVSEDGRVRVNGVVMTGNSATVSLTAK